MDEREISYTAAATLMMRTAYEAAMAAGEEVGPDYVALALARDEGYGLPDPTALRAAMASMAAADPRRPEDAREEFEALLTKAAEFAEEAGHDDLSRSHLAAALDWVPGRTARLLEFARSLRAEQAEPAGTEDGTGAESSSSAGSGTDAEGTAEPPLETVPTHADRPAEIDLLGRARLAEVLADRLRRVRGEQTDSPGAKGPAARTQQAFLVHLHAPWGAGKTSLLNFLRSELQRPFEAGQDRWVVVDFSAWQHQRNPPPWWWLLAAVRNDGLRSLREISKPRALLFWVRDLLWRLWNARAAWVPLAIVAAVGIAALLTDLFGLRGQPLSGVKITAGSIAALLTLAITAWGLIRGISRWVLLGSAPRAARVLERVHDPLHMIRRRFSFLVRALGAPVAIFIDDLDRCQAEYVVELLEGIQTLFLEEPVVYVVAADRRWVCESYAAAYEKFGSTVAQPGRPLGHLFLEKTFQLSLELPPVAQTEQSAFWERLVKGDTKLAGLSPGQAVETLVREQFEAVQRMVPDAFTRQETQERFAGLDSEAAILDALAGAPDDPSLDLEEARRAAMRRLGSPELRRDLEHVLAEFYPFVENNPRAMKRLVNAYGFERARQVREGMILDEEARIRLILWTIVKLRWPLLAERLAADPSLVAKLEVAEADQDADPDAELLGDPAVRTLFAGVRGVGLDQDAVRTLTTGAALSHPAVGA